jgi:hypothetical protein
MSIINKLKDLGDDNPLNVIADSLSQHEIYLCYEIYTDENGEEPDTIIDAIDFIINHM